MSLWDDEKSSLHLQLIQLSTTAFLEIKDEVKLLIHMLESDLARNELSSLMKNIETIEALKISEVRRIKNHHPQKTEKINNLRCFLICEKSVYNKSWWKEKLIWSNGTTLNRSQPIKKSKAQHPSNNFWTKLTLSIYI